MLQEEPEGCHLSRFRLPEVPGRRRFPSRPLVLLVRRLFLSRLLDLLGRRSFRFRRRGRRGFLECMGRGFRDSMIRGDLVIAG
jgi:hypothetical protein